MSDDRRTGDDRREHTTATWADAQQQLYERRYTGRTIVHWNQGTPYEVEIPGPSERIRIDSRRRTA